MKAIMHALMNLSNEIVEISYMDGSSVKGSRYILDPVKKLLILDLHDTHSYHIVHPEEINRIVITPFKQSPTILLRHGNA